MRRRSWFGNTMLTLVFFVGVINLVVGFALAVALERRLVIPVVRLRAPRNAPEPTPGGQPAAGEAREATPAEGASPEVKSAENCDTDSNGDVADSPLTTEPVDSLTAAAM